MNRLHVFQKYLESIESEQTMCIPAIWNTYIGFEDYRAKAHKEIEVNTVAFYKKVLQKIEALRDESKVAIKDSQIYCAMPRYTMAWDIHHNGELNNGTLIRMLILLPTLKAMNINVLYLLPITEYSNRNKKGDMGSPFAIKDFYQLDPNLHDELVEGMGDFTLDDEFHVLIEAAHLLGIRVVIDFIPRVTARDCNLIKEHPDWVYWIDKDYEKDFKTPEIPGLDFFRECTSDVLDKVYAAESTKAHLSRFSLPPHEKDPKVWQEILEAVEHEGADLFELIEARMGITTAPAHSDWINDVQPIWTDITFWKLFLDNNPQAEQYVAKDQPPYVMFDTIKANKFPARMPNQGLWDLFTDVLEHYAKEFELDGFRFDIGHTLPKELLAGLFDKVREYVDDPIFISEDLFNRNHESARQTGYNIMLGSSWKEVENIRKASYENFINELSEMRIQAYACAETHDTPRIVSREGGTHLARGLAIINNFLPNGVHFILSGYEINEKQPMNCGLADNTGGAPIDKAFFNNIAMDWTSEDADKMLAYLIKVNALRKKYQDLVVPENIKLLTTNEQCIGFTYEDKLTIFFNLDFNASATYTNEAMDFNAYEELINSSQDLEVAKIDAHTLHLAPAGAVILLKKEN